MTYLGIVERTTEQNPSKKTTNKAKGIKFLNYIVVQPKNQRVKVDGKRKGHRTNMSNPKGSGNSKFHTDQKVTKIKFVWQGTGTEEDRLRELDELLAAHGYEVGRGKEEE